MMKNHKKVNDKQGNLKPGDLAVLDKIENSNSIVVWTTWNDLEYSTQEVKFWPTIVGQVKKGEIALILEICAPIIGLSGAKIYTSNNIVGWINYKCLKKMDI